MSTIAEATDPNTLAVLEWHKQFMQDAQAVPALRPVHEAGIQRFEPGAGGDYKFLRGFDAEPTYSLHYLREPRLADAVARFLEAEREEASEVIDHLRNRSPLKSD